MFCKHIHHTNVTYVKLSVGKRIRKLCIQFYGTCYVDFFTHHWKRKYFLTTSVHTHKKWTPPHLFNFFISVVTSVLCRLIHSQPIDAKLPGCPWSWVSFPSAFHGPEGHFQSYVAEVLWRSTLLSFPAWGCCPLPHRAGSATSQPRKQKILTKMPHKNAYIGNLCSYWYCQPMCRVGWPPHPLPGSSPGGSWDSLWVWLNTRRGQEGAAMQTDPVLWPWGGWALTLLTLLTFLTLLTLACPLPCCRMPPASADGGSQQQAQLGWQTFPPFWWPATSPWCGWSAWA